VKAAIGLRVGLVGAGRWGSNYLRALPSVQGIQLVAVCDPDPAARDRAVSVVGAANVFASADELDALGLDGVVIAVPSADHAALAMKCLKMGLHVLVEKPLATDPSAARAVLACAEAARRVLLVGHLTLHHPGLTAVRSALDAGLIGKVQHIEIRRTSSGAEHRRDSALWSLGPHDIANVLILTRSRRAYVRKAWCDGPDEAGIELELEEGVRAHMEWSRRSPGSLRKTRIDGSDGVISFDESSGVATLARAGASQLLPGSRPSKLPLERQCAHFAAAMRGEETPLPSPAQSSDVVRVLSAADALLRAPGAQKLRQTGWVNGSQASGT